MMNKFNGAIKIENKLDISNMLDIITNLKPNLPDVVDNLSISKLIDNKVYYLSEDGNYRISIYFRESDEYIDEDGNITYGDFKSLYRVSIRKSSDFKLDYVKEYLEQFCSTISATYEDVKIIIKLDDERVNISETNDRTVNNVKIIIRIK